MGKETKLVTLDLSWSGAEPSETSLIEKDFA